MAYKKACKEQEECACELGKANEAPVNYRGDDRNPPKAKAVHKSNEPSAHGNKAVAPVINQVFQLYSNFS